MSQDDSHARRSDGAAGTTLEIDWRELGGPPVTAPSRRGFGSRLIERSLQGAVGGSASPDFDRDGLRCHIALTLDD